MLDAVLTSLIGGVRSDSLHVARLDSAEKIRRSSEPEWQYSLQSWLEHVGPKREDGAQGIVKMRYMGKLTRGISFEYGLARVGSSVKNPNPHEPM